MQIKLLSFLILSFVSIALADDFKTVTGKEYKNATVSRVEPDGIVLTNNTGISKVYFTELPKDRDQRTGEVRTTRLFATIRTRKHRSCHFSRVT